MYLMITDAIMLSYYTPYAFPIYELLEAYPFNQSKERFEVLLSEGCARDFGDLLYSTVLTVTVKVISFQNFL